MPRLFALRACVIASSLLTTLAFAQEAQAPSAAPKPGNLMPGMAPPKVRVNEWLAGQPVDDFKKNRVYVLEFFRSRSKPCRAFAKRFDELSQKYRKKATFAAISVVENDQADVPPYVLELGKGIGYSVGTDSQATAKDHFGFMSENWLVPASLGVPSVFIVGKDATIAWMGKPDDAEGVLTQVLSNKWDVNAAAEKAKAKADEAAKAAEAWKNHPVRVEIQKVAELIRNQEFEDALKEIDVLVAMDPKDARVNPAKYGAYARAMVCASMEDLDGFYAAAEQLYDVCADEADFLNNTAWVIADPKSQMPERHWDMAIKLATRAVEVSKRQSAYCLDTLAWAYYGNGDKEKAIGAEEEAIKASEDLDQEAEYKESLKQFQAKSV